MIVWNFMNPFVDWLFLKRWSSNACKIWFSNNLQICIFQNHILLVYLFYKLWSYLMQTNHNRNGPLFTSKSSKIEVFVKGVLYWFCYKIMSRVTDEGGSKRVSKVHETKNQKQKNEVFFLLNFSLFLKIQFARSYGHLKWYMFSRNTVRSHL